MNPRLDELLGSSKSTREGPDESSSESDSFRFACPICRGPLAQASPSAWFCPQDALSYPQEEGVWLFFPPALQPGYTQFIQEYQAVRQAEGRGSPDPDYYRDLPFHDRTGRFSSDWKIRARSFQVLVRRLLSLWEARAGRRLKILDLGAGNGWLAYRLAQRGHAVAAVDLQTNFFDGLGAHRHYPAAFLPVQADFNHLPFEDEQADLVIYNASFHYSTDANASLCEALRVLKPKGQVVILDSPVYREARSGAEMVRERQAYFLKAYGFASNAISSENYLTYARLEVLGQAVGLSWQVLPVFYGLAWALRPLRARLAGRREPAQFRLVVGSRPGMEKLAG